MTTTRLRPSIHVAPADSGVAFLGLDDSFVLSGNTEAIWTVWRAVAPMLEHGVDLTDLLGAARTPSVRQLLETLIEQFTEHNMLVSSAGLSDGQIHSDREKFAEVFGFLEAVAPDPARSFSALRAASVAVEGPADLVFAATRTLARSAVGRISAIVADGEPLEVARLAQYVSLDGIELAVGASAAPDVLITTSGAAITVGDGDPQRFEVRVLPDFAAIAAVAGPGHSSGVEANWADCLRSDEPGPASPVLVALAASTAAHQAVLRIAGLPTQADARQVIGIDAADLATTIHQVPLPPADRAVAGSEPGYVLPSGGEPDTEPATAEDLLAAAGALTDERFGLLPLPHPQALIQVPLALAVCGDDRLGVAETGEYARLDSLLTAIRGLPGPQPDPTAKAKCVSTGQMVVVDPSLRWVVAAGHDLRQLLADALARLLVTQAGLARRFEPKEIAPAADPQSWRWLKTMTIRWGHQVRLVRWTPPDLPGWVVIGAHANAGGRDGKLAGWAAGPDEAGCVQAALIRLSGAAQASRDPAAPPGPDPIATTVLPWPELKSAVATLAAAGHRLVLVPWSAQPAVADAGILLAHAGMIHDRP
jgi:hypothetical protein